MYCVYSTKIEVSESGVSSINNETNDRVGEGILQQQCNDYNNRMPHACYCIQSDIIVNCKLEYSKNIIYSVDLSEIGQSKDQLVGEISHIY